MELGSLQTLGVGPATQERGGCPWCEQRDTQVGARVGDPGTPGAYSHLHRKAHSIGKVGPGWGLPRPALSPAPPHGVSGKTHL